MSFLFASIAHNSLNDNYKMSAGDDVYKNKAKDGKLNLCGIRVKELRKAYSPTLSQQGLAAQLQLNGLDLDKNAIQKIEAGKRFVTDIELKVFAAFFGVSTDDLLN